MAWMTSMALVTSRSANTAKVMRAARRRRSMRGGGVWRHGPAGWYCELMNKAGDRNTDKQDAMSNLLDPALKVIRAGSYAAISVDDLFREAGVSEGAFFRHFRSKDDLTVAAANHWSEVTGALFHGVAYD